MDGHECLHKILLSKHKNEKKCAVVFVQRATTLKFG